MNYYAFLYRWNMMESGEGYYFDCSGTPCHRCIFIALGECKLSAYHRQYKYQTNWNRVHALADQLLKEGCLWKYGI